MGLTKTNQDASHNEIGIVSYSKWWSFSPFPPPTLPAPFNPSLVLFLEVTLSIRVVSYSQAFRSIVLMDIY